MTLSVVYWVLAASILALAFAFFFYKSMMKEDEGTDLMKKIAAHVRKGAMAYLKQQYKVVIIVFVVLAIVFFVMSLFHLQNGIVWFAFLTGGFFSGLAGFFGMKTATYASARTANAARRSLNSGLKVAFRSGAVMGLVVVGLALLDVSVWFLVLKGTKLLEMVGAEADLVTITTTMLTFGMGASTQALFARVGGGIYTKAADVGADLVGKTEFNIPEDDPRNPATIADNVGDNVGDVAGMGADLYESYAGSILATMALGASAFATSAVEGLQRKAVRAPMFIAAVGVLLSLIGIFLVRTKENAGMKELLGALSRGTNTAAVLIAAATFGIFAWLFGTETNQWWQVSLSVVVGLLAGVIIGKATEYYTSQSYKPTQKVAESSKTGPATVIISGLGLGMLSTAIPVVTVGVAIVLAYLCANGFHIQFTATNLSMGLYGIGIAAVGMLSTLGITLATDAYGPIADNAGGNAEMSGLDPEVRKRTDALDALGNTTAATGKGFAIGSAALTALALLASYMEEAKLWIGRFAGEAGGTHMGLDASVAKEELSVFVKHFDLSVMNPLLLCGLFIGGMMAFVFCAMTMKAVGRAAGHMVEEVRRQFREIPGIMEGKATPDYARCVAISTAGAQHEMIVPSLLAVVVPVIAGLVLGVEGILGVLAGGLVCGFVLATMLNNAGGAWDNAKKYIEKGAHGGKKLPDGTKNPVHGAAVIGDTVGDPCKDTSGPSLNILIKLMSMVSIVFAPVVLKFAPVIQTWLHLR